MPQAADEDHMNVRLLCISAGYVGLAVAHSAVETEPVKAVNREAGAVEIQMRNINFRLAPDIYLEVRDSEERRKRKGLPPRVVILPGWDMSDEDRFDERRARQIKSSASKRTRTTRTPCKESRPRTKDSPPFRMPKKGGGRP